MNIVKLKHILLKKYNAKDSWYNINGIERFNCINMEKKRNLYNLYYIDERGNKDYILTLATEEKACELFLCEFDKWYKYNILKGNG